MVPMSSVAVILRGLGLGLPASIDRFVDDGKVFGSNAANKEDLDVVLHRDQLGVVHP